MALCRRGHRSISGSDHVDTQGPVILPNASDVRLRSDPAALLSAIGRKRIASRLPMSPPATGKLNETHAAPRGRTSRASSLIDPAALMRIKNLELRAKVV